MVLRVKLAHVGHSSDTIERVSIYKYLFSFIFTSPSGARIYWKSKTSLLSTKNSLERWEAYQKFQNRPRSYQIPETLSSFLLYS